MLVLLSLPLVQCFEIFQPLILWIGAGIWQHHYKRTPSSGFNPWSSGRGGGISRSRACQPWVYYVSILVLMEGGVESIFSLETLFSGLLGVKSQNAVLRQWVKRTTNHTAKMLIPDTAKSHYIRAKEPICPILSITFAQESQILR